MSWWAKFKEWAKKFFELEKEKELPAPIEESPVDEKTPAARGSLAWYRNLWNKAQLRKTQPYLDRLEWHVGKIIANQSRYQAVEAKTGVPWYMVGCIHGLEAGFNFKTYLHNGDPLGQKTTHVPKGVGPFYDWETAAIDALKEFKSQPRWTIEDVLQQCERYNGTGYLKYHTDVLSPYLWACTDLYVRGRYVEDGKWSSVSVSAQVGAAAAIKELERRGLVKLTRY